MSLYFLFPPKWATIPVTAEGLLYLTLDRRRDAGRVETNVRYFSFFAKFKIYAVVSQYLSVSKKFPTIVFITDFVFAEIFTKRGSHENKTAVHLISHQN